MDVGAVRRPNGLAQLVTWMKAKPDLATFATVGVGSPAHVWTYGFSKSTGVRFQLVPYRGAAPAVQDVLAGRVDLSALEASNLLPHVQAGKMKAFALLSAARWKVARHIPILPPHTALMIAHASAVDDVGVLGATSSTPPRTRGR